MQLARRVAVFAVAGLSLFLLAPTLSEVFAQWPRLREIEPGWFVVMAAFETASVLCGCAMQRLAFRTERWFPVVSGYLVGGACERVVPGGGAAGASVEYGMLVRADIPGARVASGLTASSLLTFAALLVLPVIALPFVLLGSTAVSEKLVEVLWVGVGLFVVLSAISAALLGSERLLRALARALQRLRNWVLRRRRASSELPDRVIRERDAILSVLGERWWQAVLFTVGLWLLDLFTLMAALAAVGSRPSIIPGDRRLLRGADPRPDSAHPWRAGLRRGGPDGDARAGGCEHGRGCTGDARLPRVLLLAAASGRAGGGLGLPPSLRARSDVAVEPPAASGDAGA